MIPMLAEAADPRQISTGMFIKSEKWLIQPKVDGDRRLIVCDGRGHVEVLNRDGLPTFLPPAVTDLLARVNMPVVLDGELLENRLHIWDVPRFASQITPASRCLDRITVAYGITELLGSDLVRAVPTALDAAGKTAMIERVIAGSGEGVMAKLAASPYEPGRRSRSWRKVKVMHEIDCVVSWLGVEKANMGLHVYDGGRMIDVGEVGRGSADGERVAPGDVVKVRVVHVSADNRLVQPTLPTRRTDKRAEDCTVDQLDAARTNKNLLTTWKDAA